MRRLLYALAAAARCRIGLGRSPSGHGARQRELVRAGPAGLRFLPRHDARRRARPCADARGAADKPVESLAAVIEHGRPGTPCPLAAIPAPGRGWIAERLRPAFPRNPDEAPVASSVRRALAGCATNPATSARRPGSAGPRRRHRARRRRCSSSTPATRGGSRRSGLGDLSHASGGVLARRRHAFVFGRDGGSPRSTCSRAASSSA